MKKKRSGKERRCRRGWRERHVTHPNKGEGVNEVIKETMIIM